MRCFKFFKNSQCFDVACRIPHFKKLPLLKQVRIKLLNDFSFENNLYSLKKIVFELVFNHFCSMQKISSRFSNWRLFYLFFLFDFISPSNKGLDFQASSNDLNLTSYVLQVSVSILQFFLGSSIQRFFAFDSIKILITGVSLKRTVRKKKSFFFIGSVISRFLPLQFFY